LSGLCFFNHHLLYKNNMSTLAASKQEASARGFELDAGHCSAVNSDSTVNLYLQDLLRSKSQYTIPRVTLKRHWKRSLWSLVYLVLLNHNNELMARPDTVPCCEHLNLLIEELSAFLGATSRVPALHRALDKIVHHIVPAQLNTARSKHATK
jgi:hypothetical protein